MQALCWNGVNSLVCERVPDPGLINPHDAIVRVSLSSCCGSDLHLIDGFIPTMRPGDIIGHEFIGEIVDKGRDVKKLQIGNRVVVSSRIGCGHCFHCETGEYSLCDNTNPNEEVLDKAYGYCTGGIFGYSHAFGGYAGSHAQYVRVPFADLGCTPIPEAVSDESALFVSDAFPTGFMAADMCEIQPGDVVAIWGCGGVGQMAIQSAFLLGADRVIAIDRVPERLKLAQMQSRVEVLNYEEVDIHQALKELTGGRGPDSCIDAVGMEAHEPGHDHMYDRAKSILLQTERASVLRQAIHSCRKGGTVSVVGVYGGLVDKFPMGAAMNKGLRFRMGQVHGQRYASRLLKMIEQGEADPSFLLTHTLSLREGMEGYRMFKQKTDNCMRVVFDPWLEPTLH
jgi:threonine dehydrogenase-like Zn-dependent dehydrogenase